MTTGGTVAAAAAILVTTESTVTTGATATGKTAASSETAIVRPPTGKLAISESTVGINRARKAAIGKPAIRVPAIAVAETSLFKAGAIEASAIKISGIGSFKERPIMGIVPIVPIVTIPGRIIIVCVARKFICEISIGYHAGGGSIFVLGSRCILIFRNRNRLLVHNRRRSNIYPRTPERYAYAGIDIDLTVAGSSDQTGAYDCGKSKEGFHFVEFLS
jgi:hypothetical protein